MKIVRFQAENVKKLRCVEINPDGSLVVIGGKNGNGKTSVLDSITMALAGKGAIPSKPVRDGEKEATIEIEMDDDFIIKRTIKPDGESKVEVRTKEGAKYGSPQALLDGFAARFTFDPLAFKLMKPRDQVDLLKSVLNLDFTNLDAERGETFDDRTVVNRQIRDAAGALAGMPKHDGVPEVEVSANEINAEIKRAQDCVRERERTAAEIQKTVDSQARISARLSAVDEQLAKLQSERKELLAKNDALEDERGALQRSLAGAEIGDTTE